MTVRPPRSDVARNRRLLVEAAIGAFQELGWDVPLDTVARRAGVGNATLYRHFPTREDLYEAAFAVVRERLTAVRERYRDAEDGWAALHGLVHDLFATAPVPATADPVPDRLETSPSLRAAVAEVGESLGRALELAQRQGAVRPDVDMDDVGLLLESLRAVVAATGRDAPELWRRHLVLVLDALRAEGATPLPAAVDDAARRARLHRVVRHC